MLSLRMANFSIGGPGWAVLAALLCRIGFGVFDFFFVQVLKKHLEKVTIITAQRGIQLACCSCMYSVLRGVGGDGF